MSPVLRVRPAAGATARVEPPSRARLDLAELLLAARLAGDVPLPLWRGDARGPDARLGERLGDTHDTERALLDDALARVDDEGPGGARAGLAGRGLLSGGVLRPGVAAALQVVAGGPLSAVLDVVAARDSGDLRLRSWLGAAPGLASRLTLGAAGSVELAWADPRSWVSEVTRAVAVGPPATGGRAAFPARVLLPSELLAGAAKAGRDRRADLLPAMAAAHAGLVRVGAPGEQRVAQSEEATAVLLTLATGTRGRLRLLVTRRDREVAPAVTTWLLLDDGWHELRPGRGATSVLLRREARDLGLLTAPLVEEVQKRG